MPKVELTAEELGLINRALSDSMNYKPDDRRDEKWALLLRCKKEELAANEEEGDLPVGGKQNSAELTAGYARKEKLTCMDIFQGTCRLIGCLLLCFIVYNLAICMTGIIANALMVVMDKITGSTLGADVIALLMGQISAHPVVAIILYVVGFLVFIYMFIKRFTDAVIRA